jgi:acetylglutamate kinase
MVLSGSINKQIVSEINAAGGTAIGISGKDGNLIEARKLRRSVRDPDSNIEKILDPGFVGEPVRINPVIIQEFAESNIIPVIAPIGIGERGETYNINADTAAGAIAAALAAAKLMILTDVAGVLNADKELVSELTIKDARKLMKDKVISGGMIPKIESCIDVIAEGVEGVVIINGKVPHAVLLELFTEHGAGTLIERRRPRSRGR